jgi:hypothetical protein
MKNLISIAMFTLFAAAAGASLANVPTHEPCATAELAASTSPDTGSGTNVFDPVCTPAYVACTADCKDLSAGSLSACLRACRIEYNECLAH